jgi:hypothetical protein
MNTQNSHEKKLEELKNFNLISILNFKKTNIPEVISGKFLKRDPEKVFVKRFLGKKLVENPEVPKEVLDAFRESDKGVFSFEGVVYKKIITEENDVYFDSFADMTSHIKGIMDMSEIKSLLYLIEKSVGKLLWTRDLINMPGFKVIRNEIGDEVFLGFYDDNLRGHNLRECKINLNFIKDGSSYNLDLGSLIYFVYKRDK